MRREMISMKAVPDTSICLAPDKVRKLMDLYIDMSNSLLAWHCVDGKWTLKMKPVERVDGDEVVDAPTYSELKGMLPAELSNGLRTFELIEKKLREGGTYLSYRDMYINDRSREVLECEYNESPVDAVYGMIIALALHLDWRPCLVVVDKFEDISNQ